MSKSKTSEETKPQIDPQEELVDNSLDKQIDEIFEKGTSLEEKPEGKPEENLEEKLGEKSEEPEEKPQENPETEKTEKQGESLDKEAEKGEEQKEEKTADKEVKNQEIKLLEEMGLSKFKSLKSALEAYKNLESAYGKAQSIISSYQKGIIPPEIQEGVEGALNIVSKPRVKFEAPDPTGYTDSEGNFDIASYIRDALTDYTLNLQKSLLLGELGSAIYTLQKAAILEKQGELEEKLKTDEEASEIARKLTDMFPILEKDEKTFQKVSRAWAGESQLLGRKLTLDDFIRVAKEILEDTITPPKEEEKVETVGGFGGVSNGEAKLKSKDDEIADEILEASFNKSSFF